VPGGGVVENGALKGGKMVMTNSTNNTDTGIYFISHEDVEDLWMWLRWTSWQPCCFNLFERLLPSITYRRIHYTKSIIIRTLSHCDLFCQPLHQAPLLSLSYRSIGDCLPQPPWSGSGVRWEAGARPWVTWFSNRRHPILYWFTSHYSNHYVVSTFPTFSKW